jgi:DNA-binding CsgD family transcriptional regulator
MIDAPIVELTEEMRAVRNSAIVERLSAGVTVRAVAAEFGITHQRVSQIRKRLTGAQSGAARRPWSFDRTEWLQALRREGLTPAAIARELGVSRGAVRSKLHRLRRRSQRKRAPATSGHSP